MIGRLLHEQPYLPIFTVPWLEIKDGDPTALALFRRHYSYRAYADGRDPCLFVGPGEKCVLISPAADALFVWRRFISGDGQQGVNCAIFRNEGPVLSSALVQAADQLAYERWPGERHYTYVNGEKTARRRSRHAEPGQCFIKAGWRRCGVTKWNKLHILERMAA